MTSVTMGSGSVHPVRPSPDRALLSNVGEGSVPTAAEGAVAGQNEATEEEGRPDEVGESVGSGEQLSVGSYVRVVDIVSMPELNETLGIVQHFIEETGRWRVRLKSGKLFNFMPKNLVKIDVSSVQREDVDVRVPRSQPTPVTPTAEEVRLHRLCGHTPYRAWCRCCVAACKRDAAHRRTDEEREGQRTTSTLHLDYFFPRDREGASHITCWEVDMTRQECMLDIVFLKRGLQMAGSRGSSPMTSSGRKSTVM